MLCASAWFLKLENQHVFGASKLWNGQFLRNTNTQKYNPSSLERVYAISSGRISNVIQENEKLKVFVTFDHYPLAVGDFGKEKSYHNFKI